MKHKFELILLGLCICAASISVKNDCKITRVIDGDTVQIDETFHNLPIAIRILGIDTPEKEKRAACPKEAKLGEEATEFTKNKVKEAKQIECKFHKWDKYGGRVLGNVIIDGKDLGQELIKAGLAREYFGDKKKSWCVKN